jgi:predicted ATPase
MNPPPRKADAAAPGSTLGHTPLAPATSIRTPDQRLRVFISSTLNELAPERRAARDAISELHLTPVFFEAGARPYPAREVYRAYLDQSDVFIGIYWQSYGALVPTMDISGLEEEYLLSSGKPRLLYVKQPAPEREAPLKNLLDRIRKDDVTTYQKFSTAAELQHQLADDLAQLLTEHFTQPRENLTLPSAQLAPLPWPRSPLVDRTYELAAAKDLLLREDVGLVTLTGTGGVGKTRLAIEVATLIAARFAHGAAFISLAQLKDPDLIVPTIVHALHIPGEEGRPLMQTLLESLRTSQLLIVVDNVEQLISAAASQIARMLESAPRLKVLITSREALHIRGEWTVHVPPLALPQPVRLPDIETLGQVPAVALFVRRAAEVNPAFALTRDNADAIAEICRRLDGLPLALELAAARINVLPPELLLPRLFRRLPVLTHGARDLPERQQTLRNTIAWSYDLLEPREQRLFRSLAVFRGGFGIDGALAVERERPEEQPVERAKRSDEMLDRLESLVSKSLLRVESGIDGAPRFFMLATIQEYAHEELEARGEQAAVQERYVHFLLTLAQAAEPHLFEPSHDAWLQRLDIEDADLHAALAWCKDTRDTVELGLELVGCLSRFWLQSGYIPEGLFWLEAMLARATETDRSHARAKALFGAGLLSWKHAKAEAGAHYAEEALSIFREKSDRISSAYAQWVLAVCCLGQGHVEKARLLLEDCLHVFKEMRSSWGQGNALCFLGMSSEIRGNLDEAISYYRESLELFQQIHDVIHSAVMAGVLAGARASLGDKDAVRSYFEELRGLLPQTSNRWALGMFLHAAAFNVQYNYRRYDAAKLLYQGSLVLWREIQRLESGFSIVRGLIGLAEIAGIQGHAQRCGWLLGAANHLTPSSGSYRDALNERVAQTRKRLDVATVDTFNVAWTEGQAATLEQAIDEALKEAASEM